MKRGALLSIILTLAFSVMLPFSVSANSSLSAPFVGYNVYVMEQNSDTWINNYDVELDISGFKMTCSNMQSSGGCMTYQQSSSATQEATGNITLHGSTNVANYIIYKVDIILDNYYVGYVNITHGGNTKNWYVNGNILSFSFSDAFTSSQTLTINSYSLSLANSGDSIMYMFPIESYAAQTYALNTLQIDSLVNDAYYTYACFNLKTNNVAMRFYGNPSESMWFIFWIGTNVYNMDSLKSNFTLSQGEFISYNFLNRAYFNNTLGYILKVGIGNIENYGGTTITYKGSDTKYVPILITEQSKNNFSTDFALNYGLSNRLLSDLHLIAEGTANSNNSVTDLDDSTSDLQDSIDDVTNVENQFNTNMNSALQNIDTTTTLPTAMGTKFLQSADWVRVQFNRMTNNNPFGSVLSFSLVVGIALLVLGKIYK